VSVTVDDAELSAEPAVAALPMVRDAEVAAASQLPAPSPASAGARSVSPIGMVRPGAAQSLERLQGWSNRALAESIYRVRRVGAAGLTGAALLMGAVVLFVANNVPQGASVAALKAQIVRLAPLAKGPMIAAPGGATMLAALPQRDDAPTVVGKVFEQAKAAGVELTRGQYEYVAARDGMAARYRMTFPVHTSYPKLRDFMDRTLGAMPAVAVEGLRVERKSVGDDSVDAELKLSAFVRSEP